MQKDPPRAERIRCQQQQGGLVGGLVSAVLGHRGADLDLSGLIQGAGGLLGAFTRH